MLSVRPMNYVCNEHEGNLFSESGMFLGWDFGVPKCVSSARLDSSALMDPAFGRMFILWHLNTEG